MTMKTNVVLASTDRVLFGVTIRQNTKGSEFSVTDLQKAYERARFMHGWHSQSISQLMQTPKFTERVFYILQERDLIKLDIPTFTEMVEREGITKVLKGIGLYKTTGRGVNKTVMVDPYLWVLIAMELNPMIYAKVIIWITDTLVFDRIEAGSEYKPMNGAIKYVLGNPEQTVYIKFARAINKKVFGQHQSGGMRNLASAKELRKIADIEKFITNIISQKLIHSEDQILNAIQNYDN